MLLHISIQKVSNATGSSHRAAVTASKTHVRFVLHYDRKGQEDFLLSYKMTEKETGQPVCHVCVILKKRRQQLLEQMAE